MAHRWRQTAAERWHSSDGVHLAVPRAQYGAERTDRAAGAPERLQWRWRSSEELAGRQRAARAQFRQPLALLPDGVDAARAASRSLGSLLRGQPAAAAAGAGVAGCAAAGAADVRGGVRRRGSAEERRTAFQRRVAHWDGAAAHCRAALRGVDSSVACRDSCAASVDSNVASVNLNGESLTSNGVVLFGHDVSADSRVDRPRPARLSLQLPAAGLALRTVRDRDCPSLESAPSVVVSDYSQEEDGEPTGTDSWEATLLARRLSSCSDCSTVSSCGLGLSRRGSLLDLEAEGLMQAEDGRLERSWHLDALRLDDPLRPHADRPDRDQPADSAPLLERHDWRSRLSVLPAWSRVTPSCEAELHVRQVTVSSVVVPSPRDDAVTSRRTRSSPEETVTTSCRTRSSREETVTASRCSRSLREETATTTRCSRASGEEAATASRCTHSSGETVTASRCSRSSGETVPVSRVTRSSGERPEDDEETQRKVSDCSYSSVSTLSQDEDEDEEQLSATLTPSTPVIVPKPSQWRKVKGVVQWTPFVQTYKKQKYLWVQLAGHQGNFRAGKDGTIQKRLCGREQACLKDLMDDCLRPYVPEYRGETVTDDGDHFLQLQDLLGEFVEPCVMDCKIGVRTYLEDELAKAKENPKLRKDMYEKMMAIDKSAPTEEEHRLKAVTKPRYMVWRETISSTANLGFRIEGIRKSQGFSSKDFKTTRSPEQIREAIIMFTDGYPKAVPQYLERLKEIQSALSKSTFFQSHEFIGSSLLFVHDANNASVWMIDFAKTTPLPAGVSISHWRGWQPGNHEDGYLIGAGNLAAILTDMVPARDPA